MVEETTPNTEPVTSDKAEAKPAEAVAEAAAKAKPPAEAAAKAKPPKAPDEEAAKAPAAKAKPPKAPALEDKPFIEFMEQDFTPALKKSLITQGLEDMELTFAKKSLPLADASPNDQYWQLIGNWQKGQRQFNIYFLDENINGKKAFSYSTNGSKPSSVESFMIDERKVNLDLMILYTLQRLNGQKWLALN